MTYKIYIHYEIDGKFERQGDLLGKEKHFGDAVFFVVDFINHAINLPCAYYKVTVEQLEPGQEDGDICYEQVFEMVKQDKFNVARVISEKIR